MKSIFVALIMVANSAYAIDGVVQKAREKAKFALIEKLEHLVNIEECSKDIHSPDLPADALPRSCNKIDYLAKYFFTKKDQASINTYLEKEQSKIFRESRELMHKYKISALGTMTLSDKCIISNKPVNLDRYLTKIRANEDVIVQGDIVRERNPAEIPEAHNLPEISNHN